MFIVAKLGGEMESVHLFSNMAWGQNLGNLGNNT